MKPTIISAIITLIMLILFSCKKSENVHPVSNAMLTIVEPVFNQSYKSGDTLRVTGTVSNEVSLHGYNVAILNNFGDSLFHVHNHTHATKIVVNEQWVSSVMESQELRVIVSSPVNHDGAELKTEIRVLVEL